MDINEEQKDSVIRVSFAWMLIGIIAIIALGILGGVLASQVWPPQLIPLTQNRDQLISTVQEVTISPNTSSSDIIKKVNQSVLAIRAGEDDVATAFVVTNDGLLVTASKIPKDDLSAIDNKGAVLQLEIVGEDSLFGLTYLRVAEGVLSPLDIRTDNLPVAWNGLIASRSVVGGEPRAESFYINEYVFPTSPANPAVQKLARGIVTSDQTLAGSPLLDDNGAVAGVLIDPAAGLTLPVSHLRESMQRVASGQREKDPFNDLGVGLGYENLFVNIENRQIFVARTKTVRTGSLAAKAGLRVGDVITSINGESLDWNKSIAETLAEDGVVTFEVLRGSATKELIVPETEVEESR